MENLNLEKFNPKMAEVKAIANQYRDLTIKGVDDVEGYAIVKKAQIDLVHTRNDINKSGKKAREGARSYINAVLKLEKELIAEIIPVEEALKSQRESYEALKIKSDLIKILPDRKERLKAVDGVLTDDEILNMDSSEFQDFLNKAHSAQLAAKEAEIAAEKARIDAEREKLEKEQREEKICQDEARRARQQAIEDARLAEIKAKKDKEDVIQAEKDKAAKDAADLAAKVAREKQEAIDKANAEKQEAIDKANAEKQAIIDEQNAKEAKRLADEEKKAQEAVEEAARLKAERENKAVQDFLKGHGVTQDNIKDFIIKQSDPIDPVKRITLFKKIGEIEL